MILIKRFICTLLIFFLVVSNNYIICASEYNKGVTVNMDVDFEGESYVTGKLPPYNHASHFINDNGQGEIKVDADYGNKYLYLCGKKTTSAENPVIVIEDIFNSEAGSFTASFRTEDVIGRKAFFIRLSDASKINLLEFYGNKLCLLDENTGYIVTTGVWHSVKFEYIVSNGSTEIKAYFNGNHVKSKILNIDISTVKMDLRFHVLPSTSENSTFMIDNIYSLSAGEFNCIPEASFTGVMYADVSFTNTLKRLPEFLLDGRSDNIDYVEYISSEDLYRVYFKDYLKKNTSYTLTVKMAEDVCGQIISGTNLNLKTTDTYLNIDNYIYNGANVSFSVKNVGNTSEQALIVGASYLKRTLNDIYFFIKEIPANSSDDISFEFENSQDCLKKLFVFKGSDTMYPLLNKIIDESANVIIASELVMCLDSSRVRKDNTIEKMSEDNSLTVRKINNLMYVPLEYIAKSFGNEFVYNNVTRGAYVIPPNGNTISFFSDSSYVKIGDNMYEVEHPPLIVNNSYYVSLDIIERFFSLHTLSSEYGAVVVSKNKVAYSVQDLNTMVKNIIYDRPTKERILEDFVNTNASHPRILINKDNLIEIKNNISSNSTVKSWYEETIKKPADKCLELPRYKYELRDGLRLLYVANDIKDLVQACSLAYLIEGDEKYAKRAVDEVLNAAVYPDWNPDHFLDVAEMCWASAICYDWLYDYLNNEQKSIVREAIIKLGLNPGMEAYLGTADINESLTGAYHNRIGWKEDYSNWSFVCNGGLTVAALAIMDDTDTEFCADIVSRAIKSIEYPLSVIAPDGVWEEGVTYWSYAMTWMTQMFESMEHSLGTSYDLYYIPGMPKIGYFPLYNSGPTGAFNVGDAGYTVVNSPLYFFFADKFNDAQLNNIRLDMMKQYKLNPSWKDVIHYRYMASDSSILPKDSYMKGIENVNLRSGWQSNDALYIGVHGGSNSVSHGDLDLGSFVIDALGERWASDLSNDDYNLPGYWGWPTRALYYRKRAEGHNLYVVNPDENPDQVCTAEGKLLGVNSGEYASYGVFDITSAYADKLKSAKRAVALYDDRTKIVVQDEIVAETPVDILWFMQTKAKVNIDEDGKSAILSIGNKRLKMLINASTDNFIISSGPAKPLSTSPNPEGQAINKDVSRISITFEDIKDLNVQVVFIPYYNDENVECLLPSFRNIDDILSMNVNVQNLCDIKEIRIDGKIFEKFSATNSNYHIVGNLTKDNIEFTSDYDVTIEEVSDGIKLTASDPSKMLKSRTYYIKCQEEQQ